MDTNVEGNKADIRDSGHWPVLVSRSKGLFDENSVARLAKVLAEDRRILPFAVDIAQCWIVIAVCFWAWDFSANIFFRFALMCLVATRQHGLSILLHDLSHAQFFNNRKLGDIIGNFLIGYPHLFVTVGGYRKHHLFHHRFLNSPKDPDWASKQVGEDWKFPRSRTSLFVLFLKQFFGFGLKELVGIVPQYAQGVRPEAQERSSQKEEKKLGIGFLISFWVIVFAIIAWYSMWVKFLFLWIFPVAILAGVIHRIRSIAEHLGVANIHDLNMARTVLPNFLEAWLISPFNINFHIEHHLYPQVPYYNLPKLSQALRSDPLFLQNAHISSGYLIPNFKNSSTVLKEIIHSKGQ